jgi:carbon monoxide dehydrogenase subunit G
MNAGLILRETRTERIAAHPEALFDLLDDPARFGAHMSRPSAAMLGGTMNYHLDQDRGQAIGSVIRMTGSMLGLRLSVSERVIERAPPSRKAWETFGEPRLLILSWYRMGFEIAPEGAGSQLSVFIDYQLPSGFVLGVTSRMLGPVYARWCLERIIVDAHSPRPQPLV